ELLVGGVRPEVERGIRRELLGPFEAMDRVITPTPRAWKRAGEIVAALVRAGKLGPGDLRLGFLNECVLAASAREHGFVLVTRNTRDFERIATVEPMEFTAPGPALRARSPS